MLDAHGEPVLGSDGKPLMIIDSRVPSGGSIGAGGVILDANGEPVLGADGVPLYAAAVKAPALDAPKKIKQKRARKSEIVAAGRMLTLTRMRARDVPDLDAQNPKPGRRRNPNDVSGEPRCRLERFPRWLSPPCDFPDCGACSHAAAYRMPAQIRISASRSSTMRGPMSISHARLTSRTRRTPSGTKNPVAKPFACLFRMMTPRAAVLPLSR